MSVFLSVSFGYEFEEGTNKPPVNRAFVIVCSSRKAISHEHRLKVNIKAARDIVAEPNIVI